MWISVAEWIACGIVLLANLPLIVAALQSLSIIFHDRTYLQNVENYQPRVAVLIPAWNEAPVIPATIARMCALDYPQDRLRIFIIDDASTDETPEVMAQMIEKYGEQVVHIRRENGGQGKAHTLNAGLDHVLADDWAEAILITDADVLYTPESLAKMTRHLSRPEVGAVTAYIKEGSQPSAYVNRYIAYEYSTAQAVTRRAYNLLGVQACLAGGAQLHRRDCIEQIGGRIDTTTLAEDTVTTFNIQLAGSKVVFEPNALVYAEEPAGVRALWGQRIRWGRGNIQVTSKYRWMWFRGRKYPGLGSLRFGTSWFVVLIQPFLLIASSIALLFLNVTGAAQQFQVFRALWITNGFVYVIVIATAWAVDPKTMKRCWKEAVTFSGIVSAALVIYSLFPAPIGHFFSSLQSHLPISESVSATLGITFSIFIYAWLSVSMLVAWLGKVIEKFKYGRIPAMILVVLGGYGSLLCAVTLSSIVSDLRGKKQVWVKTEKTGKVSL